MRSPVRVPDRARRERLFLDHLPWIERTAASLVHRAGFSGAEAEDAASFVRARLIEDDYAVLRKFRGSCRLPTYLVTVMANLVRDYRVKRWGKWRPSATATREGPVAVALERLLYRDRVPREQAIQSLLTQGLSGGASERELRRLAALLPARARIEHTPLDAVASPAADDDPAEAALEAGDAARIREALDGALAGLPDEDAVIVRLRFHLGLSVAQIARALGIEQKPLYRRLEAVLRELRSRMEARGVDAGLVREAIESAGKGWL